MIPMGRVRWLRGAAMQWVSFLGVIAVFLLMHFACVWILMLIPELDSDLAVRFAPVIAGIALVAPFITRIGYRPSDRLGLLVPILGPIWAIKWMWRIAQLARSRLSAWSKTAVPTS